MNFLKKIFNTVTICCFFALFLTLSCSKSTDDIVVTPPRAYDLEYGYDKAVIDKFLNTYTYSINVNNDIVFEKPSATFTNPLLVTLPTSGITFPQLRFKNVALHDISYKVYYLVFNEGNTSKKPSRLDDVLIGYRGFYLENQLGIFGTTQEFENNPIPTSLFSLTTVIRGWGEILPLFGTGIINASAPENNPTSYTNYGVGAIFIPSGLGYFNEEKRDQSNVLKIPSYSPLVFTIKLFDVKRADQDGDKIESMNEIVRNADDTFTFTDTDADGTPDFNDIDDDNDGLSTLNEIKKADGTFYSYGDIPDCSGNVTSPTRIKKHLVKCQ